MQHSNTILIMAAGTGGHIFPALAVATELQQQGFAVEWLGTSRGMEVELVGKKGIRVHRIAARGITGKGMVAAVAAPFMALIATIQALRVMIRLRPLCVLGLGGYVTGPGGIAAWLCRRPLLIHEQNAVAGLSNRLLAPLANQVLESFPGTFSPSRKALHTGNPIRREIVDLHGRTREELLSNRPLKLLVLGGSQGARAVNRSIPEMLSQWTQGARPAVLHQTGAGDLEGSQQAYREMGLSMGPELVVKAFIDDMGAALLWADLVIARSGATTVFELAVAGLPSILIPYPWHKDQQQLHNARWLEREGAACILEQGELNVLALSALVSGLDNDRARLLQMGRAASRIAILDASTRIARYCREAANV